MKTIPHFPRPEVREEAARLEMLGFAYIAVIGGHPVFEHPLYGRARLPLTPSGARWRQNFRSQLARKMGLSRNELEQKLGLRSPKRSKRRPPRPPAPRPRRRTPRLRGEPTPPRLDTEIEAKSTARAEARRTGDALLAQRLDRELADLFAQKRREAA
jgi:hypothetical protein